MDRFINIAWILERNIKNMKISNKYDRLVRKLIAGESSSEEMEELAHWNVVETKMKNNSMRQKYSGKWCY